MVKIETDATSQGGGQILTRVEAFLESLRARKRREAEQDPENQEETCRACCVPGRRQSG